MFSTFTLQGARFMWTSKMLRKIEIRRAEPAIKSFSWTISMSVTLPSAGESSRLLSVGAGR